MRHGLGEVSPHTMDVFAHLTSRLSSWHTRVQLSPGQTIGLPVPAHVPTPSERDLLTAAGGKIAGGCGIKFIGIYVGKEAFEVCQGRGRGSGEKIAGNLNRSTMPSRMPSKQSAGVLIAPGTLEHRMG